MASLVNEVASTTVNPRALPLASIPENQNANSVVSPSTLTIEGKTDKKNISCELNSSINVLSTIKAAAQTQIKGQEEEKRQDIELALVIDKSGSMHGSKIDLVKETLLLLQTQLGINDSVSLVTFDTHVKCEMPLTKLKGPLEKEKFTRQVKKIHSGSSTNLSGGLAEGIRQLKKSNAKNVVRAIILLTDGQANHGITDMDKLARITTSDLSGTGISLFTYGYGSDHNSEALRKLSLSTDGGQYYFIEKIDTVGEAIGDCLGGIMSVVAQNIILKATACSGVTIKKVHEPTRPTKSVIPNKCYEIRFGDMYSEERRDTIFEVECDPAHEPQNNQELIKFEIEYLDAVAEKTSGATGIASIDRVEDEHVNPKLDPEVVDQVCRVRVAETMISSNALADSGKLKEAKELMESALKMCTQLMGQASSKELLKELIGDLKEGILAMSDRQSWRSVRSYKMKGKMATHAKQRSCSSAIAQTSSYRTARKGQMQQMMAIKSKPKGGEKRTASTPQLFGGNSNNMYATGMQQPQQQFPFHFQRRPTQQQMPQQQQMQMRPPAQQQQQMQMQPPAQPQMPPPANQQ